jgi:hypothetical protein
VNLEKKSEEMFTLFKDLVSFFGEPADSDFDGFFGIIDRFLLDFDVSTWGGKYGKVKGERWEG